MITLADELEAKSFTQNTGLGFGPVLRFVPIELYDRVLSFLNIAEERMSLWDDG